MNTYPNTLLLASSSASRKYLLTEAQIPFFVVQQNADETKCDWGMALEKIVENIALYKMDHVIMPSQYDKQVAFVLTADTLSENQGGIVRGKPANKDEARMMIKEARAGSRTSTAFCLDKKIFKNGIWEVEERIVQIVTSQYLFDVSDKWLEIYLEKSRGLSSSSAITIEEFGNQFLKFVHGSYTAIVGLPMYEVHEALEKIGFF